MIITFSGQIKLNYISPYDPKPPRNGRHTGGYSSHDKHYGRRNMYPFDHFFRNRRYPFDHRYMDRFDWDRRRPYGRYGYGFNRPVPPPVTGQL